MKGIILAGGAGTRLHPITLGTSKQLLPVYDKPMIYYPLSTLMEGGIREILVICTPQDIGAFWCLLKDGSQWGVSISYAIQSQPKGIAQAFTIGEDFIGDSQVCLILGDNLFWTEGISEKISLGKKAGYCIFSHHVSDPQRFGVIERNNGKICGIEEKPEKPKSNEVSIGLYIYKSDVCEVVKTLKPSNRLEFEITDVNNHYLEKGVLECLTFSRGSAWLDTGSADALSEASEFVRVIQNRQGVLVGSPDEIAFRKGWIDCKQLKKNAEGSSKYSKMLHEIIGHECT